MHDRPRGGGCASSALRRCSAMPQRTVRHSSMMLLLKRSASVCYSSGAHQYEHGSLTLHKLSRFLCSYAHTLGLGAYHSGVEVAGKEWSFAGGAGIFDTPPRIAPGAVYRETIEMGVLKDGISQLTRALEVLRNDFGPNDYNIFSKNCNHFADALCRELVGKGIPGYINRLAFVGSFFSCFMPRELTQEAPVNPDGVSPPYAGGSQAQPSYRAFEGAGVRLAGPQQPKPASGAGSTTSSEEQRERVRQAALARFNQGTPGSQSGGTTTANAL